MNVRPPKRRKVGARENRLADPDASESMTKKFWKSAANWSLEEDYENRAGKRKKKQGPTDQLPIRITDGLVSQVVQAPARDSRGRDSSDESDESGDDQLSSDKDDKDDGKKGGRRPSSAAPPPPPPPPPPPLSEATQVRNAKEELAKIALRLNENPEENAGAFQALAQVGAQSSSLAVQKLCLVTQMAVYKDVIPGYRIRSAHDALPGEKLSAEVRRLRTYEHSLLVGYQAYLQTLGRLARHPGYASARRPGPSLADVALSCACTLLTSVAHFNFRQDLLRILVGKLSQRRPDAAFHRCRQALEQLFREDPDEGRPSLEAVSLLAKMAKARDYRVHESVLNTLLHLRLLSDFSGKASHDSVDPPPPPPPSLAKKDREFRTKRDRKRLKEQKALDRDMAQADALVSHEERQRIQAETLKIVFVTYFRILQRRTPHLMGAVLEGLARYAHLINQDFFADLLEALKDLVRHSDVADDDVDAPEGGAADDEAADDNDNAPEGAADDEAADDNNGDPFSSARNTTREALLCTVTAYALLAGQDAHNARGDLHLDLSFFTTHLFRSLFPLALAPDIEQRANSLQSLAAQASSSSSSSSPFLSSSSSSPSSPFLSSSSSSSSSPSDARVNLQTTTVLLVRCLTAVLLPPYNIRSVPPLRLAAFAKQLMTTALHVPEKSAQALLALLHDVAHTHGRKISALWNTEERKGDGRFQPLSESVEGSNPFATTVWEGELLRRHYCPKVREGVKALEKSLQQ